MSQSPQYFLHISLARCGVEHILTTDDSLEQFCPGSSMQLPSVVCGTATERTLRRRYRLNG